MLLAGASKEPLASWNRTSTATPYNTTYGAGALNIFLAYRILNAGGVSPSGSSTVPATAWSVASANSIPPSQSTRTYFFDIPTGATSTPFSATLAWHRIYGQTLANLDLHLYAVTSGTFTIGAPVDASISTVDNVEHIYRSNLGPGRYALQVTRTSGASTRYALAWRSSPTVTITATDATASELDGSTGLFTLTRTGPTTSPLVVPITIGGTAVSGTHYTTLATSVTIPAGASTTTLTITPVTDDIAQGDRTVIVSLATDYSLSSGTANTATVTIKDKPFDAWRYLHFTTPQLADPLVSGDTADADGDGLNNLLEYALDSDPVVAAAAPLSTVLDGNRLAITYLEATGRTDLTYTVETTEDLGGTWQTGATVLEETTRTNVSGGQQVTVRRINTADRQFLRLRVTR